jgi:hypothetical protein
LIANNETTLKPLSQGKMNITNFSIADKPEAAPCAPSGCTGECGGIFQIVDPIKESNISLASALLYIEQLDLQYIINKMCSPTYPLEPWTIADATRCANAYKNFLFLQKKYFSEFLTPSKEIDEFWHNHILHTKNYFQDCQAIFGHYLHHEPAAEEDDENKFINGFIKTKQLYLEEFGIPLVQSL